MPEIMLDIGPATTGGGALGGPGLGRTVLAGLAVVAPISSRSGSHRTTNTGAGCRAASS